MAVFLVNQCAFAKLPNANNDQQTPANGGPNQRVTGLNPSSNICGRKFDTLFELIHHIEDTHITGNECPTMGNGAQFYNGHPHPQQASQPHMAGPHDRHHMTQIMNGGWLPTSSILRIFNSTQKPVMTNQKVSVSNNTSSPYHIQNDVVMPAATTQPHYTAVTSIAPTVSQPIINAQPINVNYGLQPQHIQMQPQQLQAQGPQKPMITSQKVETDAGGTYHMQTDGPMTANTSQTHYTTVTSIAPTVSQPMVNAQPINVNYTIQPQQIQLQAQNIGTQQIQTQSILPQQIQPMAPQQIQAQSIQPQPVQPQSMSQMQPQPLQPQQLQPQVVPQQSVQAQATQKSVMKVENDASSPYHVQTDGTIAATSQPHYTTVTSIAPTVTQPMVNAQPINVNYKIQPSPQPQSQTQSQAQPQPVQSQPQQTSAQNTQKPYKCPDCNKTYKTQHGLRTHQSARHENNPQPSTQPAVVTTPTPATSFKCPDCNKTYKTQHGLRTHQSSHRESTPSN